MRSIYKVVLSLIVCSLLVCCHKSKGDPKVVGGLEADGEEWGFGVVYIVSRYIHNDLKNEKGNYPGGSCSAAVVSHNTLLTAAHCVTKVKNDRVYLATQVQSMVYKKDPSTGGNKQQNFKAIKINPHGNYRVDQVAKSGPYDVALLKFEDNAFTGITPLSLYPKDVILMGYGCKTTIVNNTINDQYGSYTVPEVQCDKKASDATPHKRYGHNSVAFTLRCTVGMLEIDQKVGTVDSDIYLPSGEDVQIAPGDSGSPVIYKDPKGNMYIVGTTSYGYRTPEQTKYGCFSKPIAKYNMDFLSSVVAKGEANLPGINMSLGVVELNGKVRVVEKQYNNLYTKKIKDTPFTLSSLATSSNTCQDVSTIKGVSSCWKELSLEEKSELEWN